MSHEDKLEQARKNMAPIAADYHELFSSPTGQRVMKHLKSNWDNDKLAHFDSPNKTYWMLGARDLLISIEQMIKIHEKLSGADDEQIS
jgi:hypothetical protein